MIQFTELRIDPTKKKIIIDVAIKDSEYYKDIYIDTINIDTNETFIPTGPSDKTAYTYKVEGDYKSIRLELSNSDGLPSFTDHMFFIWISTKGVLPIGLDEEHDSLILGTVVDLYPIYQYGLHFINELSKDCKTPNGFIDFILQIKAFRLNIRLGHYVEAIKYWEKFFKLIKKTNIINRCGCSYEDIIKGFPI
jgi:hypothetical protein